MTFYSDVLPEHLIQRLQDEDAVVRRVAVRELAESISPDAVTWLLRTLQDSDTAVRQEAALLLDEFDLEDTADALVDALTHKDSAVREAAARALADVKIPALVPALLAALKSDDAFVLASALNALKQFRDARSKDPALSLLIHADPWVRRNAVVVLGYLGDPTTLANLSQRIFSESDSEVRRNAIGAIQFGNPHVIGPWLIDALRDEHWQVRAEAAKGLGKLRVHPARVSIIATLQDDAWQVVEQAVLALGALGHPETIPAVGAVFGAPHGQCAQVRGECIG